MIDLFTTANPKAQAIRTPRLLLVKPSMKHFEAWVDLRQKSRNFLEPFEPVWPTDDLTKAAFRRRVKRYQDSGKGNSGAAYLFFTHSGDLIGGATISRMMRGVAQSCAIGYWIGEPHIQKGYMTEALTGLLPTIFIQKQFRRLEAACLPHNAASIKVLEKTGFSREGYAREYLKIAGKWQDHVLFAMLESDFRKLNSQITVD